MLTKQQLDGLVKVGAIGNFAMTDGHWRISVPVSVRAEYGCNVWFVRYKNDEDALTAHLKRFTIQKAKERWGDMTSFDITYHPTYDKKHGIFICGDGEYYDKEFNTELEAIVNACIAVSEGGQ